MSPDEIEAVIRRLFEALNATNAALSATVAKQGELERKLNNHIYQSAERFMLLECGQLLEEVDENKIPPEGRQH